MTTDIPVHEDTALTALAGGAAEAAQTLVEEAKSVLGPRIFPGGKMSVPRLEAAPGAPVSNAVPHPVSDAEFRLLVAVLRITVPYTGIILSTRENAQMRRASFELGVSQISAASRTNPGGYSITDDALEQFAIDDQRSPAEVADMLLKKGLEPVWKDFDRFFLS